MIVRLMAADRTGCGHARIIHPGRVVADQTTEIAVQFVFDDDEEGALRVGLHGRIGNENVVSVEDPQCDVLVMQRPAHRHLVEAIPFIQAYGTAVVVDLDDDFDTIDIRNAAWAAYDPQSSPSSNKIWARRATELCDLLTVTTPALARRYGQHGRVAILPNYIPEAYLKIDRPHVPPLRIGWAGSVKSHPGDLEVMQGAMRAVQYRANVVFSTVGSARAADVMQVPRHLTEVLDWVPIEDYPYAIAHFDIGLVPLKDSPFNRSKSWLKGLELAACGVPFVASPTEQYRKLSELGAGDLVTSLTPNNRAWRTAIERLRDNEDYRAERAAAGRATAATLTYEGHAEEWVSAWRNALALRRAR